MKTKQQYKEFSERFRKAMKAARMDRLTMEDAGRRLGFSGAAISYWWNGKRMPRPYAAEALAKKLKCSAAWLLTGEDIAEPVLPVLTEEQIKKVAELITSFTQPERRKSGKPDRRKK